MIDKVGGCLNEPVRLATEEEIAPLFHDCAPGAIPPISAPYGLRSVVDEALDAQGDIYFEGGDHRTVVHLTGEQFQRLMANVSHGRISQELPVSQLDLFYSGA